MNSTIVGPLATNLDIIANPVVQEGGRHPIPLSFVSYFSSFFSPSNLAKSYGLFVPLLVIGAFSAYRLDFEARQKTYIVLLCIILVPILTFLAFFQLFLQPQRYMFFIYFPIVYLAAIGLFTIVKVVRNTRKLLKKTLTALILLIIVAGIIFQFAYSYEKRGYSNEPFYNLGIWIEENSEIDSVFATYPKSADWIRIFGKRAVVISDEFGGFAPTYVKAQQIFTTRMNDTLDALYTESETVLKDYIIKYNVTHFVIIKERYSNNYLLSEELYPYEPYNSFLKKHTSSNSQYTILESDMLTEIYSDHDFIIKRVSLNQK